MAGAANAYRHQRQTAPANATPAISVTRQISRSALFFRAPLALLAESLGTSDQYIHAHQNQAQAGDVGNSGLRKVKESLGE